MSEAIKDVEQKLRAGIARPLRMTTPAKGISSAALNDNTDSTDDEPSSEDESDTDAEADSDVPSDSEPESDVEGDSGPESQLSSDPDADDSDTGAEKRDRQPSASFSEMYLVPGASREEARMHAAAMYVPERAARSAGAAGGDSAGVHREHRDRGDDGVCCCVAVGR